MKSEIFNRRTFATVGLAVLLILAGCAGVGTDTEGEQLAEDIGENVSKEKTDGSFDLETKMTEKNQEGLVKAQPPQTIDRSLERQNLIRRHLYLNDQNNQHYVGLISHGQIVATYTAQGKVSSVNSKLTNDKQIVKSERCMRTTHSDDEAGCFVPVESPQMDGSYGTNGDAIFFFTSDGKYVEWSGEYLVSEQPIRPQGGSPTVIVKEVEANNSSA